MQIQDNRRSPNFSERKLGAEIKFIVLHYTELRFDPAMEAYCDPEVKLSCHYLIHKDGTIYNLVEDKFAAWHAGISSWHGLKKINDYSIGIELDNLGNEAFAEKQMKSCVALCHHLQEKHGILSHNIIGHSDIAPDRKLDPGIFFDWSLFSKNIAKKQNVSCETFLEEIVILQQHLAKIGYNIEITGIFDAQTNCVIRAFQAHFCPQVIWDRGGIEYYRNPDSIFSWDEVSDAALKNLYV